MTNQEAIVHIKDVICENNAIKPNIVVFEQEKEALYMAIEALENQKTGHWTENAPEWQNIDPPYICSECGNFHLRKTNYCDQCGAKMEGE